MFSNISKLQYFLAHAVKDFFSEAYAESPLSLVISCSTCHGQEGIIPFLFPASF